MHQIILGAIFSLLIGSFVAIPAQPAKGAQMQYFPLAPGNWQVYQSTNKDGTWLTKRYIADEWGFLGGPIFGTFTIFWTEAHQRPGDADYAWQNQMWLWKTADTLMWQGFEDKNAKVIGASGLPYVTEPVVAGAAHKGETTVVLTIKETGQVIPGALFKANYTIDAIEAVTVPAGTFNECIKVHEEEITPDGDVSFWVWYAKGVGAVKYYYPQQNERIDVLQSYHVDLTNDPWDAWFMPKVPILVGWVVVAGVALVIVVIVLKIIKKKRKTPAMDAGK